jgi:hypothetical protein
MNADKHLVLAALFCATAAFAQVPPDTPPPPPPAESTDITSVGSLGWLNGCWGGQVNKRDFREQWAPLRGNTLIGMSSTVLEDKLQNYEYLRIEARADGVYYVALPSGKPADSFKLTSIRNDEREGASVYTFENTREDFPQRIVYRRGSEGWLYASIEGKINGQDRQQTFPMRRLDCETGDFIRK